MEFGEDVVGDVCVPVVVGLDICARIDFFVHEVAEGGGFTDPTGELEAFAENLEVRGVGKVGWVDDRVVNGVVGVDGDLAVAEGVLEGCADADGAVNVVAD